MTTPWHLRRAASQVRAGGIIAYPTEAVFGLGCDPRNPRALERLLALKGRQAGKGLILIAAEPDQLGAFIDHLPSERRTQILASWPGPVTWVVPARPDIDPRLSGGRNTLAVRVTAHPVAAALCRACASALVSTSANLSGHPPARNTLQVRLRLRGETVDYLVPGRVGAARRPTSIRDALSGAVLRA